jgi:hypothetical protein
MAARRPASALRYEESSTSAGSSTPPQAPTIPAVIELEHGSLVDEKVHPQGIELFGKAFNLGSAAGRLKGLALPDHPAIVVDGLECRGRSGGEATATHAAGHLESQPKRHIICDKKGRYWRGYRS